MIRTFLLCTLVACGGQAEPPPDSARAEIDAGRYWHGAALLERLREEGTVLGPERTLLLARAYAGYRNWGGVVAELEGEGWLDGTGDGAGWRLLARALEEEGRPLPAADAYARYLDTPAGRDDPERVGVRARRARVLAQAGRWDEALDEVAALAGDDGRGPGAWMALVLARDAAGSGDTARVRRFLAAAPAGDARDAGWSLPAEALAAAGDTAAAVARWRAAAEAEGSDPRRARAHTAVGRLLDARGDRAGAVEAWRAALTGGSPTADAAEGLVEAGAELDADAWLTAARTLQRAGRAEPALHAYDRYVAAAPDAVGADVRLARARLMADVASRRDEAVRELRALSEDPDPDVGAPALVAWAALRRSQGRDADRRTLEDRLVERFPGTEAAGRVVFLRADAAHDRREYPAAVEDYDRVAAMSPEGSYAGLSAMRVAQIRLERGDSAGAAERFEAYLEAFPEGRRWEEAAWWLARLRRAGGRTAEADSLLDRIEEASPHSYYAVLSARERGREFAVPFEADPTGTPDAWVAPGLDVVRQLDVAGLEQGASGLTSALVARAEGASPVTVLALAEGLIERGRTIEAINLGWALRRRDVPWSLRLLRVIYPFPYRDMAFREAAEWGVDPWLVAAVMRQESAFDADIVSSAGAIGLMQVMPPTGRQLASRIGPHPFSAESLEEPEVNMHLGTAYLKELGDRYPETLPLVLSSYNAGPHRAVVWAEFPEADDPLRLTERIPYSETRDYVRQVTRNLALYRFLHGGDGVPSS